MNDSREPELGFVETNAGRTKDPSRTQGGNGENRGETADTVYRQHGSSSKRCVGSDVRRTNTTSNTQAVYIASY